MTLIELQSVSKSYGDQPAVSDFTLGIEEGDRLVLLGPSGCGKTTVLRLLAGFIAPDTGRIAMGGETLAQDGRILTPPEERGLGMVFQDLALWPHLTVRGNVEFGLSAQGVPRRQREARIADILALTQMQPYVHTKPAHLSGGQQQRVALARALVLRPKALLMDEPLSSLDLELNIRLRKEILSLQRRIGFTLLYVTHDREEAFYIGTRVVVMKGGRIELSAPVDQVREHFRKLSRGLA